MKHKFLGPLILITANLFFMCSFSLVKYISQFAPMTHIILARFLAGPVYLIPFFLWTKKRFHIDQPWVLCIRIICGISAMTCLFTAFKYGSPGKATLIFELSIIWTIIGGFFLFKETLHPYTFAAIPIAFLGIYFVIQPTSLQLLSKAELFAGLGSLFNAGVYLSLKELRKTHDTANLVLGTYAVAALIVSVPTFSSPISPSLGSIGWLTLMCSLGLCGQLLMTLGFKYSSAGVSSAMMLVSVPLMYLSGVLFFGETTNMLGLLGIFLVLASLFIAGRYQ